MIASISNHSECESGIKLKRAVPRKKVNRKNQPYEPSYGTLRVFVGLRWIRKACDATVGGAEKIRTISSGLMD